MEYNENSLILYEGVSGLDGVTPIVCILTGLQSKSSNTKTGDMLQTWIMRQDIAPHEAVKQKLDNAVCGECKFSGGNGCYVQVYQAPNNIWKSYKAGRYRKFEAWDRVGLHNRYMRFGSYGDPVAVPISIWQNLIPRVKGYTGYTHQAFNVGMEWDFLMGSADTDEERKELQSRGWRTFTTIESLEMMSKDEIICPATKEGGNKAVCQTCRLCNGNKSKAKSINVVVHGANWVKNRANKAREIELI
jgi:hypothetical protein